MSKTSSYLFPALAIGTSLGIFWWITRKPDASALPPPPGDPKADPVVQATGWAVNDLCTSADMLDPSIALAHAEAWRASTKLPPVPIPDLDQLEAFADALHGELDRYFAQTFPQCNKAPDGFFVGDDVSSPAEAAADVAERVGAGEPIVDPLHNVVMAVAGLGDFQ